MHLLDNCATVLTSHVLDHALYCLLTAWSRLTSANLDVHCVASVVQAESLDLLKIGHKGIASGCRRYHTCLVRKLAALYALLLRLTAEAWSSCPGIGCGALSLLSIPCPTGFALLTPPSSPESRGAASLCST